VVLTNLDHPLATADRDPISIDDQGFVRLSHEIAFTTYALGLAREVLGEAPELSGENILFEDLDTPSSRDAVLCRKARS
jgi:hypothetical protein